ncbi:hypothetical protein ACIF8T_29325 [Streptomyces sp. NPDC085946]|uniref:hypothetical protein n=1 Tax=Streptomyces sp. NPDC085946 TaxID=3365744 RepID=UPI0037D12C9F
MACLCTPLPGEDPAARLPPCRPRSLPSREPGGGLTALLPGRRERIAAAGDAAEAPRPLVRSLSRHLVRTAFTLVVPHRGGRTGEPHETAEAFAPHGPERARQVSPRPSAAVRRPGGPPRSAPPSTIGPWLARVHGAEAPRPDRPDR